jgi:hypothetical protein
VFTLTKGEYLSCFIASRVSQQRHDLNKLRAIPFNQSHSAAARTRVSRNPRPSAFSERWPALVRYCDDGLLEINNNAAERALRAVAVGSSSCTSFSSV